MIQVVEPTSAAGRLFAAIAARGVVVACPCSWAELRPDATLVLSSIAAGSPGEITRRIRGREGRVLVLGRSGTHRDARVSGLRTLWDLEEAVRASQCPTLVLRVAPMLGPESPLWLRLRSRPRLPRSGRNLLNPVAEQEVVETLDRALSGRASWQGWYDVAGPEVWSLAELAAFAEESGPRLPPGSGEWEPPIEELESLGLCDTRPWLDHFGVRPAKLAEQTRAWAA